MLVNKQNIIRGSVKLIFELLIVFFGVLLAFLASDWSAKKNQQQRFVKTLNVLQKELTDFITYSPIPVGEMKKCLQEFRTEYEAGNFPPPPYYREPRASAAPTAAWEALLASGAYEMLEPQLFYEMTIYYNRVISMNTKFNRYMLRCEDDILANLQADTGNFYEGRQLRGKYQLLILMLEEVIDEIEELGKDAQKLQENLAHQFPSL